MTTTISLKAQQQLGLQATQLLRESESMLHAIAAWDALTPAEKAREYADHFNPDCAPSRYYEVPGFEPEFCMDCGDYVHPDFRNDPEGECSFSAGHRLAVLLSDRAAA